MLEQAARQHRYGEKVTVSAGTTLLFVYGTLRSGAENHALLHGAQLIAEALTEARYELVDMGGYPALLEDGNDAVAGELYEVDDALLSALDVFEEVPELYERKRLRVSGHEAECYVMRRATAGRAPRIASGDWLRR